jgi:hypothetical protein
MAGLDPAIHENTAPALAAPATRPPRLAKRERQRALPAPDNAEKIDADKNQPITV